MTLGSAPRKTTKIGAPGADDARALGLIRLWLGLLAASLFVTIFAGAAARPLAETIAAALGAQAGRTATESLAAHHALLGRGIALAFVAPLPWIFWRGRLRARLAAPLTAIALLGAAQAIGDHQATTFAMIHGAPASGLAPALHLMLAAALLFALIFVAVGLGPNFRDPLGRDARNFRPLGWAMLVLCLLQFGLGAYAAGFSPEQRAPAETPRLIAAAFAPGGFGLDALLDDGGSMLLIHRLTAYLLLALSLFHALHLGRETVARRAARRALALAALCLIQIGLGAALFWFGAPPSVALGHQFVALAFLALISVHLRKLG